MGRKFMGLLAIVAMTGFIGLVSMPTVSNKTADAGLLRRIFSGCGGGGGGLQRYSSSCGGMQSYSGCGGGGLQMAYSSCGGGGGDLQFAPQAYYAPTYVQPTYYAPASGCPGGVCPPGVGLTYAPTYYAPSYASAPVPLNPGETYVTGSLRAVTPAQPSALASNASPPKTRPESRPVARNAAQGKAGALPEGVAAYQLTQDDCHVCEADRQQSRQQGVPLEVLSFSDTEDAFKIVSLARQLPADVDIKGVPFYLLVEDGVVISYHSGDISDFKSLVAEAEKMQSRTMLAKSKPVSEPPKEESKLDRIEVAMLQMAEDMRALRVSLEGQRTALK